MRRQYYLSIRVGLGLCSHGHRNHPGCCQKPCSSPNPWHAVGWMLKTQCTPLGWGPRSQPSLAMQLSAAWGILSKLASNVSRSVQTPSSTTQPWTASASQRRMGMFENTSLLPSLRRSCAHTHAHPGISGVPIPRGFASGQNVHRARRASQ